MSTLYLHIGTPKTGTTSLQRFFIKNRMELRKQNCKFPVFSNYDTGVHISHNGRFLSPVTKDTKYIEKCYNSIYKLANKYQKIILTEELLWNNGGNKQKFWEELQHNLSAHSITLKVIVYLRRQDEYIISHWAQKVKGRKTKSITFDKYLQKRNEEKNHLDYYKYLNNIASVIGKENIIVRPYEFCQFEGNNKSIFSDFLKVIDIECNENFKYPENLLNQSLKGNVLEAKRYLNMVPEFSKKSFELREYFWEIQDEIIKLGKLRDCSTFINDERQKFMESYNDGNAKIAREYMGRADGNLFILPLPNNDSKKKIYTVKEIQCVFDMLMEKIKNSSEDLFSPDEFQKIYNKALIIVNQNLSTNKKLPLTLIKIKNVILRKKSHTS